MMVDRLTCGLLLQAATDRIATTIVPPHPDETVHEMIRRVRETSAHAKTVMRALLLAHYPNIGWTDAEARPEQQGQPAEAEAFWIYDPIDGAYHYLQGLPLWSASLALIHQGRVIFAAVYDPTQREVFSAVEGGGAMLNGAPLRVSHKRETRTSVVGTALPPFGYGDPAEHAHAVSLLTAICERVFVVRQMASGSLQLAYVAAGRLDAYWEVGRDIHDWMAGALLVREAGGAATSLNGAPFDWNSYGIVAGPGELSTALLAGLDAR